MPRAKRASPPQELAKFGAQRQFFASGYKKIFGKKKLLVKKKVYLKKNSIEKTDIFV